MIKQLIYKTKVFIVRMFYSKYKKKHLELLGCKLVSEAESKIMRSETPFTEESFFAIVSKNVSNNISMSIEPTTNTVTIECNKKKDIKTIQDNLSKISHSIYNVEIKYKNKILRIND